MGLDSLVPTTKWGCYVSSIKQSAAVYLERRIKQQELLFLKQEGKMIIKGRMKNWIKHYYKVGCIINHP